MGTISEQAGSATFTIDGVRADALTHARTVLGHMGITGVDGDAGTAVGRGGRIDYRYDSHAGTLALQVQEIPEQLRDLPEDSALEAVREIVAGAVRLPSGDSGLAARPGTAGQYCYVIPKLTNNTGFDLTYATSDFTHGVIDSYTTTIANGAQEEQFFDARSAAASGLGVEGKVTYQLTDGTPLTVTFRLLSTCDHSFAAGFTGQNAARWSVKVEHTTPTLDGYTYLEPTITIARS